MLSAKSTVLSVSTVGAGESGEIRKSQKTVSAEDRPSMTGDSRSPSHYEAFLVRSLLDFDAPHYLTKFSIVGCPSGLEILDKYEHLVVNRRLFSAARELDGDKRLHAYSQFDVKNSRGMQMYLGMESVTRRTLRWVRDARQFEVGFFDFHCRKVFSVRRRCGLISTFTQYCCLCCTYGFPGWGNAADVFLADGSKLGYVSQQLSCSRIVFHIYDKSGDKVMTAKGVASDGILDVFLPGEDDPVVMIETMMTEEETFEFYRVTVPKASAPYGLTFFRNTVSPEHKALLLAAIILLDFILLLPITDYPHMAEMIPGDYEASQEPTSELHKDGSRELIILTEMPERGPKKKVKCGAVIWCTKLMCMCVRLGMRRNAVRCLFLIVLLIIIFGLILFGLYIIYISVPWTSEDDDDDDDDDDNLIK